MTLRQRAAVLLALGADAIEKYGLAKGKLQDGPKMCVRGALNFAGTGDAFHWPYNEGWQLDPARVLAEEAIVDELKETHPEFQNVSAAVVNWNNDKRRTASQVYTTMRLAIRRLI